MPPLVRICHSLWIGLLPLASVVAQTTWTVTHPNGVQAAIAAAAPGDVILLPNTGGFPDYAPFLIDKGVTILGNGSRIGVAAVTTATNTLAIQVPPGQHAHLDGLDLTWSTHAAGNIGVQLEHRAGVASLQHCSVRYGGDGGGAVRVLGGALVLQSCSIEAVRLTGLNLLSPAAGVEIAGGAVTIRDCTAVGRDAGIFGSGGFGTILQSGMPGASVLGGSLHAERSHFTGGSGQTSLGWFAAGAGVRVGYGSAAAWLSDCTLAAGFTTGIAAGTAAIIHNGTVTAQLCNVTLIPGLPTAPPTYGSVDLFAPLTRLELTPDLQRGVTSTLAVTAEPNALFALGLALDALPTTHPFLVEPVWIVDNISVVAGLLDSAGGAVVAITVPAVPGLEHQLAWMQAASGVSLPLHASTLAGGSIR